MKYYLLTDDNKLAKQLTKYYNAVQKAKQAWHKLGDKYECQIASLLGVPMGFINPNDECYSVFDEERGYDVPIEETDTATELAKLPHMPINILSIVGVKDSFIDVQTTFVAVDVCLIESGSCKEISEALYYDAKTAITGHVTRAAKVCPHCGNSMVTADDKLCYKCHKEL